MVYFHLLCTYECTSPTNAATILMVLYSHHARPGTCIEELRTNTKRGKRSVWFCVLMLIISALVKIINNGRDTVKQNET